MPRAATIPPEVRALLGPAGVLLWGSWSGRILLGRLAGLVPPAAWPAALADMDRLLRRARFETAPVLSPRVVERELRIAWERPPTGVLDEVDLSAPVVSTPLAQVHRARLDGTPVAVKVRRPGVEAVLRGDLAALRAVGGGPAWALAHLAALGDLEHEAGQQHTVARALRGVPGVLVPRGHLELARPSVMVSAWLTGPTLRDATAADPLATARTLVAAHVAAARAGHALVEPRPQHVVMQPGGTLGLLGVGAAVRVDTDRADAMLGLLSGLRRDDPAGAAAIAPDARVAAVLHQVLRPLLRDLLDGRARLGARTLASVAERGLTHVDELRAGIAHLSADDVVIGFGAAQLAAVLAHLEVDADWVAVAHDAP